MLAHVVRTKTPYRLAALTALTHIQPPTSRGLRWITTSSSPTQHTSPALQHASPHSHSRNVIVKLLQTISGRREVEQYLKYYAGLETPKFAVIKVGGGLILDECEVLSESLAFLAEVGLLPVVIHGAGPQLNDELTRLGIVSDYIGGMRITTPAILKTARKVFSSANLKLVNSLEANGVKCRPIVSGVFSAELLDQSRYQYVGQITSVDTSQVLSALSLGIMPVLTCMGESESGQILNINADVAAQELAKALKPVKIVYLSANGGINDEDGKLMPVIDLDLDYERLMTADWFKHGNRLKLKEIKQLLDSMPLSSTVAITSARNLPKELFTHKGSGTLVRRSEKVHVYSSLNEIDRHQLTSLIESSFGGRLDLSYLDTLNPNIHRIYLSESYRAVAIVTKDRSNPNSIPYLDKFAVAKASQSEGSGQALWNVLRKDIPAMFWRSRSTNPINPWYFERSDGSLLTPPWCIFWYGLPEFNVIQNCIEIAKRKPTSIDRSKPVGGSESSASTIPPVRLYHTSTNRSTTQTRRNGLKSRRLFTFPTQFGVRSFATAANSNRKKVGLIGARGHTGVELIKLIAAHPDLTISVASSRALKGQTMSSVVNDLPKQTSFADLSFTDLSPEQLPAQDVDVWILALPNDLAKPYVTALDGSSSTAKVVDLSADYRFDKSWAYGLPERHGARKLIAQSSRIANPGCYATGAQCSLLPLEHVIDGDYPPTVFGVSGYSGAGTTPSRKNDINALRDNLMPYSLINHMHEREVSNQLSSFLSHGIRFMPHVAPWFRGITLTVAIQLNKKNLNRDDIIKLYTEYYKNEPLIKINIKDIPEVHDNMNQHDVRIGGFTVDNNNGRLVVTTTLDNLLKGAATQCLQNVNLSLNIKETAGIIA